MKTDKNNPNKRSPNPIANGKNGLNRRQWLNLLGLAGLATVLPTACLRKEKTVFQNPPFDNPVARFPGKIPMRLVNDRPPQLDTPWQYFKHDLTPNEAFFVRWHLQPIPTHVDLETWRLNIGGHVHEPLALSMDELQAMEAVEIVAVCQCSGNSRKYFEPRVPGGQWDNGAMGNARWKGVRLSDILDKARVKEGAVEATFNGLDTGPLNATPDFVKSLKIEHARQPEVIVAYEMNGEPLPLLNGFPIRLIVPGWYATYWVKSVWEINVVAEEFKGHWMAKAYHIPANANASEEPNNLATDTVPINKFNTRSLWVEPNPDVALNELASVEPIFLEGIAFDGGAGIKTVEFSVDDGATWTATTLGEDLGNYSFRRWRAQWTPPRPGTYKLLAKATNNQGETQPMKPKWNRGGYMRNVIEEVHVRVS